MTGIDPAASAVRDVIEAWVVAGDVAFAWALLLCGTDEDLASAPHRRLRLSFGLRHESSGWQIVHEHHSFAQA